MSELNYQRRICNQWPGYAKKWASSWNVGVPDLVLVDGCTFYVEVKFVKDLKPNWCRKLQLTELQKVNLRDIAAAGGVSLVALVERWTDGRLYLSLHLPPMPGEDMRVSGVDKCFRIQWTKESDLVEFFHTVRRTYYDGR